MAKGIRLIFLLASHFLVSVLSSRSFTIENKCEYTIWPASYDYSGSFDTSGLVLEKGNKRTINASSSWIGRVWGRSLCSTNETGAFECTTGDCSSGDIECLGNATQPATMAEFNLASDGGLDYYDVSVIDGYNLPMLVTPNNEKCKSIGCDVDMKKTCPSELMMNMSNNPITCQTTCQKDQIPDQCCVDSLLKMVYHRKNANGQFTRRFSTKRVQGLTVTLTTLISAPSHVLTPLTSPSRFARLIAIKQVTCWKKNNRSSMTRPPLAPHTNNGAVVRAKRKSSPKLQIILGVLSALVVIIIIAIVGKVRANNLRKSDGDEKNIESVVMLKRYSYAQVKKMTKSFADVLGKGGFGIVYKGKLLDGTRDAAVKILKDSNENGEEFINEVASMSRTSHINIVPLLGFCYEGNKKAIIYEFMPNGSLDQFISEKMSTKMEWEMLYNIAVGVSRGLEYLHNRCVSRIVHFDIKPQNILIDGDFCPKISDFGLARLCKNNESIMSMLDARGTAGYIAPEVFSKNFGGVSHKSDVYSYGMVVLGMIGANNMERAQNATSNNTSMYFPDWIYKDLEKGQIMSFLADQIIEEEDEKIVKKMVLVGLWCIQTNPFDRPPMSKVVEMLEGSLETLEIPPKPLLCLPARITFESDGEIQETSSFLKLGEDTSHNFQEEVQDIA